MALYEADHLFDDLELRPMDEEEELELHEGALLEMAESYAPDDEDLEDEDELHEEACRAAAEAGPVDRRGGRVLVGRSRPHVSHPDG